MELKPGYKQTEVGVIPEQWRVSTLGETCTFENGDRGKNYPSPASFARNGIPFVNAGHIAEGHINRSEPDNITRESYDRLNSGKFKPGDILFCLRGSLGKFGIVGPDFGEGAIASSLVIVRPKSVKLRADYLSYYFSSYLCALMIEKWAGGAAQPNLGVQDLARFTIPYPRALSEQRAIAGALSDADALLRELNRLITKKRDLKQAAMQQLLTGQTRLPGEWVMNPGYKQTEAGLIPEDWDVQSFKKLFNISAGGDVNPKLSSSEQNEVHRYPIYSNALTNSGLYGYCAYADHPCNSITITARGTLGVAKFRDHKYTAIGRVLVLEPKRQVAGQFFADFINSRVKFAIESTGVPQLTAPQISGYLLAVPPDDEQCAIAEVLSDMDAELAALEQRRDKTRALKQAMMQELLTGKTRLVSPRGSHA